MPRLDDLLVDLKSGDEARAHSAVSRLAELDSSILPALLELTHASEIDHRWWAICALAVSPHARTENLVPCLNDPAPEVRQAALLALCTHADESAIPALVHALADEDSMTAGLAVNALVKIGRASVPALLEVMKAAPQSVVLRGPVAPSGAIPGSPSHGARILALRALAEIKDHRAIPVMMKAMQEDSALLQHWASEGLERLGLDMVYIKP